MAMTPNPAQLSAIRARGGVLVSAAAGSGKTAVLARRVIDRILGPADPVDADRLLVVTFTNAAAAEMKQRISAGLAEKLRADPGNPALLRQRILLSNAPVCTMDSYCLELVREHFHSLGVPLDFKIADPGLLRVLEAQAMDAVLDEAFEEGSADFFSLAEFLGADNAEYNLKNAVEKIYVYLRSLPFPGEWTQKVLSMYADGPLEDSEWVRALLRFARDALARARRSLEASAAGLTAAETFQLRQALAGALEALRSLEDAAGTGYDALYGALAAFSFEKPARSSKLAALGGVREAFGALDLLRETAGRLAGLFAAPLGQCAADVRAMRPAVERLFSLVDAYWKRLDELKAARRILDFADVEYKALALLAEKRGGEIVYTQTARDLSRHFREVLVDEYQDTNDLQDTIITALSDGGKNLFLVGDVKQSIYRFRKANPDNFLRRYRDYPDYDGTADPSKILLSENYRSRAGICDYVNFLFGLIMSPQAGELAYTDRERLVPGARYPARGGPDVSLRVIDTRESEEPALVYEARHIADYILEMTRDPEAVQDEADPGKMRRARFSDFAVLLRSPGARQGILARECAKKGIPVWMTAEGGFLSAVEVATVLALLRVIDNPLREVHLLALLHSPIFAFSSDRLANIRADHPNTDFYRAVRAAAAGGDAQCADFLEKLGGFRRLAVTLPADALLRRLYDETGYFTLVQAMENGAQRRANLLLLLEYARGFESAGFKGLPGFLRFIDRLDPEASSLSPAGVATQADDVVRIMSVHRAKGLQFPICILAAASSRFNRADSTASMVLHEKYGVGLRVFDERARTKYSTLPRQAVSIETERAAVSEELRVLYVALTRARERLVLCVTLSNPENKLTDLSEILAAGYMDGRLDPQAVLRSGGFSDWILLSALLHPDGGALRALSDRAPAPAPAGSALEVRLTDWRDIREGGPGAPVFEECEAPPELVREIGGRLAWEYPYKALEGVAAKRAASRLTAEETDGEFLFSARPAFLSGALATPAERGIAIHTFMEYADYARAKRNVEDEIARLAAGGFMTRAQADLIDRAKLRAFFESALYKRVEESGRVFREQRFITSVPLSQLEPDVTGPAGEEPVVIQGSADCVFVEDGALVIVDYKTDRTSSEEKLAAHYAPQLRLYSAAVSKNLAMPVRELLLYSFTLKTTVPVPLPGEGEPLIRRA